MIDRDKVLAILARRFPGARPNEIAAAANAIVGLEDDWEEVAAHEAEIGYLAAPEQCSEACVVANAVRRGASFRLFLKRGSAPSP